MKRGTSNIRMGMLAASLAVLSTLGAITLQQGGLTHAEEGSNTVANEGASLPTTLSEARARAQILHETIRGTLQVVHRDFFDDENPPAIPSASFEDVFDGLAKRHHIQLKWLTVETDVLNVDHKPQNDFERQAVKALAAGKSEFEVSDNNLYQYAGPIRLASQCLKCHVKNRISTEDRTAGLVISMPVKSP